MAKRATWEIQSLVMVLGPLVSPAMTTWLVVAIVSHATRSRQGSMPAFGPSRKNRSTTSSEMRSQTLSGWPSETDSLVKKYEERAKKCLRGAKRNARADQRSLFVRPELLESG